MRRLTDFAFDAVWVVICAAIIATIAIGINAIWPSNWNPWADHDFNREVTVQNFLQVRGWNPNTPHAVCAVTKASDNTAFMITLNARNGCGQTIKIVVPAENVRIADARRASAVFSYNRVVYFKDYRDDSVMDWRSPNSGGKYQTVKTMGFKTMAQLIETDLHGVVLRLPPQVIAALK
jgi:hypothetical protein